MKSLATLAGLNEGLLLEAARRTSLGSNRRCKKPLCSSKYAPFLTIAFGPVAEGWPTQTSEVLPTKAATAKTQRPTYLMVCIHVNRCSDSSDYEKTYLGHIHRANYIHGYDEINQNSTLATCT
jgi:hypothetical protein